MLMPWFANTRFTDAVRLRGTADAATLGGAHREALSRRASDYSPASGTPTAARRQSRLRGASAANHRLQVRK
jgi:hypothetical protein